MKAKHACWQPEEPLDTPYKRAKQEWDERIGSVVVQAKNWRLAAFASFGLVLIAMMGMIYLGAQPKLEPYIVEINQQNGDSHFRGPVSQRWQQFTPSKAAIQYHLQRFITHTRSISSDPAVLKQNWFDAYALVTQKASSQLGEYVKQHDPFKRAETQRISIEITAMVPMSAQAWQVDWVETLWGTQGNQLEQQRWRGMFQIQLKKPEDINSLTKNPIGLYIDEFNWAQIYQ